MLKALKHDKRKRFARINLIFSWWLVESVWCFEKEIQVPDRLNLTERGQKKRRWDIKELVESKIPVKYFQNRFIKTYGFSSAWEGFCLSSWWRTFVPIWEEMGTFVPISLGTVCTTINCVLTEVHVCYFLFTWMKRSLCMAAGTRWAGLNISEISWDFFYTQQSLEATHKCFSFSILQLSSAIIWCLFYTWRNIIYDSLKEGKRASSLVLCDLQSECLLNTQVSFRSMTTYMLISSDLQDNCRGKEMKYHQLKHAYTKQQ